MNHAARALLDQFYPSVSQYFALFKTLCTDVIAWGARGIVKVHGWNLLT
jgi:hypothetical protein